MVNKVPLKDLLFNRTKVEQIAKELQRELPNFKKDDFVSRVVEKFPELQLKARIAWITECLKQYLPSEYRQAVSIILNSLPAPNDPSLVDNDFGDFIYAPYANYVAEYGCSARDLNFSLNALHELTMRFSAEDAIRYFINAFPQQTLKKLLEWSNDPHYHVRRLCSEGTRPKLPWSQKITTPIAAPLPILDNLFSDSTRFVTRSVANHINDISKIDPPLAVSTLERWKSSDKQSPKEMSYIVRHALRTLIKQGDSRALTLLGVSHSADLTLSELKAPTEVKMNTELAFSFQLQSNEDATVIVDYIIYFQNRAGKLNSRKVFKLKECSLVAGETITFTKNHLLREHMTTRRLFRGRHELEIQVNGKRYGKQPFWIV